MFFFACSQDIFFPLDPQLEKGEGVIDTSHSLHQHSNIMYPWTETKKPRGADAAEFRDKPVHRAFSKD